MKKVYLAIGMVLLLAVAPLSVAQGKQGHGSKGSGRIGKGGFGDRAGRGIGLILRSKEMLGLDDTQVEQLTAISNDTKGQFKANAEAVKAKKGALAELVKSGALEAEIRAAASQLGNAIGDQAVLKAATKAKVKAVLTDDQETKLKEMRAQRSKGKKGQYGKDGRRGRSDKNGRKDRGKKHRDPKAVFARIDTDGNGAISLEEFQTHMEQRRQRRGNKGPKGPEKSDD